jgi:glycosyltransferase involved in cell wall biosynthesis
MEAVRSESNRGLAESYPLSIVIPVRRAAGQLKRCLEALLDNDLTNVEILVVDDASDDSTAQVATELSQRLTGLNVSMDCLSLKQQLGPAGARNEGFKRTTHPHTLFLDADIVVPKQTLTWIRETLDLYSHREDVAGVLGCYSETLPWDEFLTDFKNLCVCFLYAKTDTLSPYVHTPIFCVRRAILEQVGGFDPGLATGEDFRLGIVLGSRGYRFVIDRRIKGIHLKRYNLTSVVYEDWRRVRDLRSIPLSSEEEKWFAFQAHRPNRLLSLLLPGPILIFGALGLVNWISGNIAWLLLGVFYLCNLSFLRYCTHRKGWSFTLKVAVFLFIEMLWAEAALLASVVAGLRENKKDNREPL